MAWFCRSFCRLAMLTKGCPQQRQVSSLIWLIEFMLAWALSHWILTQRTIILPLLFWMEYDYRRYLLIVTCKLDYLLCIMPLFLSWFVWFDFIVFLSSFFGVWTFYWCPQIKFWILIIISIVMLLLGCNRSALYEWEKWKESKLPCKMISEETRRCYTSVIMSCLVMKHFVKSMTSIEHNVCSTVQQVLPNVRLTILKQLLRKTVSESW